MLGVAWSAIGLGVWSLLQLAVAAARLTDPHAHYHYGATGLALVATVHLCLAAVPWGVWWRRRPDLQLSRAATVALRRIQREALRLGPAFDELAADAEHFWQATGALALSQYRSATRDLNHLGLRRLSGETLVAGALQGVRERSLADAERAVTALERLAIHLLERRIVQLERTTVPAHVEVLRQRAERSLEAHDEARALVDPAPRLAAQ
jgi:hypothetical protein